ncbi:SAM-dependent methyltransferase [Sphingomonas vulcanisoli]|uniref:SAM-dependent methyltransferase n=1 Tax=Sphingomonas vulcanisoli TaxID=1658060 RepID=A0ABX0TVZ1_9SPHN|nr:class I SAM-dependent methyltransferase [Sphingomonas vulcanisoli]NIJ08547.1 SAM-dependent methyltransferase [Sphingomonas vulcanisoli]
MNEAPLLQSGRSRLDFMVSASRGLGRLHGAVRQQVDALGIAPDDLPDDLDARDAFLCDQLAGSDAFHAADALQGYLGKEHGRVARDAFNEIAPAVLPELEALEAKGPATLTVDPDLVMPDYFDGVDFHSTLGGWDRHEQQGYIHGEIVHRLMVAKVFPLGDMFAQRRAVLKELPRQDYRDILELGTSSGHFTVALQQTFPDAHITGIDLAAPMLRQALRVANEAGWAWTLKQMAAEKLAFADDSFDLVTAYSFLHEMPESAIRAIYREALRVLRPGGSLLIADITPYAVQDKMTMWRADRSATHGGEPWWRESAMLDWAAIAREEGFADATGRGIAPKNFPWLVEASKA